MDRTVEAGRDTSSTNPPAAPSLQLTSNKSSEIHGIFSTAHQAWQYVVADKVTRRCVVIDPVRDDPTSGESLEKIFKLVRDHQYIVDHILETYSSVLPQDSAAWGLRMRLLDAQGFAPQICGREVVSSMERLFLRKYGSSSGFTTTLAKDHSDGERIVVGRMRIVILHVANPRTLDGRAYLIGPDLFGAHSLAGPGLEEWADNEDPGQLQAIWTSMRKVLQLDEHVRIHPDHATVAVIDGDLPGVPTVSLCRSTNEYAHLELQEFIVRRRGELKMIAERQAEGSTKRHWGFGRSKRSSPSRLKPDEQDG